MSDSAKILDLCDKQIPTIVSFDAARDEYIIGEEAKKSGIRGITNVLNFKKILGESKTELNKKSYWIAPEGIVGDAKVLTGFEAASIFIGELLKKYDLPDKIVVGVPAVSDQNWITNYRHNLRLIFENLGLKEPVFFLRATCYL